MLKKALQQGSLFFKTDLSYVAKGGAWIMASKVVSSAASFALLLTFGNLLSKTTYGVYQYVLSIVGIFSITALPGMTTALNQAVAQGKEGVIKPMTYARMRWGVIGSILSISTGSYYFIQDNITLTLSFFFAALFLPLMESLTLWSPLLTGRKEFKYSSIYTSLFQIFRVSGIILTILTTKNIVFILISYFFITTLGRALFTLIIFVIHKPNTEISATYISYGKHLSLMNIIGSVATQADKIILWHFLGPVALATYSFALTPVNQLQSWFKSIETLAFPKFASSTREQIRKTLPKKLLKMMVVLLPLTMLYIVLAPLLYKIFLPQYIDSVIYSQVLALILLFLPQKLLASSLVAQSQKKSLYILKTINPLAKIMLFLIFIPSWGIWGLVIAILLSYLFQFFSQRYFFKKI